MNCPHCGEEGSHYFPPSTREPGGYICLSKTEKDAVKRAEAAEAEVRRLKSLFPDADSIGWVFVHRDDYEELLAERDRLRDQIEQSKTYLRGCMGHFFNETPLLDIAKDVTKAFHAKTLQEQRLREERDRLRAALELSQKAACVGPDLCDACQPMRAALEEAVDYVRAYKCQVDAIKGIPGASAWLKKYEEMGREP